MSDDRFDRLFSDLAAAQEGALQHERHGELGDLVAESFADSRLEERLAGAVGQRVELRGAGEAVSGVMRDVGAGWCLMSAPQDVLIALPGLDSVRVRGTAHRSRAQPSRLSIASPLRLWAAEGRMCRVLLGAQARVAEGVLDAVAADYLQLKPRGGAFDLIPLSAVFMVRTVL